MYEVFVLVEKQKPAFLKFIGLLCLCLAVTSLALSCFTIYFLPIVFIFAGGFYLFFFRCNLEYEYSYFDGEIRFAKVMNKSRRKNLKTYSAEELVQIAPSGDRSVISYENNKEASVVDYTSRKKGVPYYDMVIRTPDGVILFKVELDDAYLDAVCIKHCSKVIRRKEV